MYNKILVPLDGSEFAKAALPYACELVRRTGGQLTLLHVIQPNNEPYRSGDGSLHFQPVSDQTILVWKAYVGELAEELRMAGLSAVGRVIEGSAPEGILRYACEIGADAIVMSTHGRRGIERLLLGGNTDRIIHQSRIPIILIRPTAPALEQPITMADLALA